MDRHSNWPLVEQTSGGSEGLIRSLRMAFVTYGIPDDLSSDDGPEFTATATTDFLKCWGVNHRKSSVSFPHSNCRAEVGVKTVKRMITNNTGPNGELDLDEFQHAILHYRNIPDQNTKISPAMCLFGRPTKDFIPILPGKYRPHDTWVDTLDDREEALQKRDMKTCERLSGHTKLLKPLVVGDNVRIQNRVGHNPKKWDRTGSVVGVRQFDQYVIRMDGSGRVTLRNRKFLRKYVPVYPQKSSATIDQGTILPSPNQVPSSIPTVHARISSIEPLLPIPDIDHSNEQILVPADTVPSNMPWMLRVPHHHNQLMCM